MKAVELAQKVIEKFGTNDVFEIAEKSGIKIIYQKWFPITLGEFDWQTKTICINENTASENEKIIAHELGHYFMKKFGIEKIENEENFCDEFANVILKNIHAKA